MRSSTHPDKPQRHRYPHQWRHILVENQSLLKSTYVQSLNSTLSSITLKATLTLAPSLVRQSGRRRLLPAAQLALNKSTKLQSVPMVAQHMFLRKLSAIKIHSQIRSIHLAMAPPLGLLPRQFPRMRHQALLRSEI
jgi:hypothetical protein